jgi:hypothetical protein
MAKLLSLFIGDLTTESMTSRKVKSCHRPSAAGIQQFGFDSQSRLIVRLNPALAGYSFERLPGLYRQLQDRFNHVPGVLSASLALHSPMDGWNWNGDLAIEGRPPSPNSADDKAQYDFVGPRYFETIGTRLLRGRLIDERDVPASHHVAVVIWVAVRRFWSGWQQSLIVVTPETVVRWHRAGFTLR